MFGGLGLLVVVVLLVVMNSGGGDGGSKADQPKANAPSSSSGGSSPSRSSTPVPQGTAKKGAKPDVAAPALSREDLSYFQGVLDQAKDLINQAKTARTGRGDNATARKHMSEASDLLQKAYGR